MANYRDKTVEPLYNKAAGNSELRMQGRRAVATSESFFFFSFFEENFLLMGIPSEDASAPENTENVHIISVFRLHLVVGLSWFLASTGCWLCLVVLSIFMQQKYFFGWSWSCSGCSHADSLFTSEEQKKMHSWWNVNRCHLASFICDVTDLIKMTALSSCVFSTFKCGF